MHPRRRRCRRPAPDGAKRHKRALRWMVVARGDEGGFAPHAAPTNGYEPGCRRFHPCRQRLALTRSVDMELKGSGSPDRWVQGLGKRGSILGRLVRAPLTISVLALSGLLNVAPPDQGRGPSR